MAQIEERLVELINLASIEVDGDKKVEYLYQIKELALNHGLIDNFLEDILAFQNERSPNVKKFVLGFIEAACKYNCQFCPKIILNLNLLLNDTNTEVLKRSIQAATQFYRALVQWIVKINDSKATGLENAGGQPQQQTISEGAPAQLDDDSSTISSDVEKTWLMWLQIKNSVSSMLETTNNDGIRTQCIKFIETIVLMQTQRDKYTDASHELNLIDPLLLTIKLSDGAAMCGVAGLPKNGVLFNEEHKLDLVEDAKKRFDQLVVFHGTSHISSVNLMATMQTLVVLAKQRYRLFMGRVIQAMESLNAKLPPTLTESQRQSVKKFLKLQLTLMLKHPYSLDRFQHQITQLLQLVGSRQPEIHRVINDFKHKFGSEDVVTNIADSDVQKKIKLEPGIDHPNVRPTSQTVPVVVGKTKHLDLNKLTQELDEKEKRQIVVDSVRRILGDERKAYISPAQMDIKKKVLSTLANEFHNTECPLIIQDYIFEDLKNRHEICYAIVKKYFDVAVAKAAKRQINLFENQTSNGLLDKYLKCYYSYLDRAMNVKDEKDKKVILDTLYALKDEYYRAESGESGENDTLYDNKSE